MLHRPGPMVDGPGPAVMQAMAAAPAETFATQTTQVRFLRPEGMSIGWKVGDAYANDQLTVPAARYNFVQGATYRLKFTDIPGRPQIPALYPTLQIAPTTPATDGYLSHNSIPIEITDADLDQVESNNFVTKVIFLPDPKFQDHAIAGVRILVSHDLRPGEDPVKEAARRGTIMAVLRMGNMDLEMGGMGGGDSAMYGGQGQINQASYNGAAGEFVAPTPIATHGTSGAGIPGPQLMGVPGAPGQPAINPISGVAGLPQWGMPSSATPIGLPGPPHLPLGRPAGLKSHTVRNLTRMELPKPTDHMLIDVQHKPGYRMPAPAKHIEYTETHPMYGPQDVSKPAWIP
jgi:hypothetical protein